MEDGDKKCHSQKSHTYKNFFNKIPIAKFIKTDLQFHLHFNYDRLVQNFFPIIRNWDGLSALGSNPFIFIKKKLATWASFIFVFMKLFSCLLR